MGAQSDVVILALIAAVGTICGLIGKYVSDQQTMRIRNKELNGQAAKEDNGSDENLRRDMMAQIATQTVALGALQGRLDIVASSATAWQDKFYDLQLKLGISESIITRLTERVSILEQVKDTLTNRLSDFASAFEKERSGLKAEITTLLARIAALEVERDALLARISLLEASIGARTTLSGAANTAAMKVVETANNESEKHNTR